MCITSAYHPDTAAAADDDDGDDDRQGLISLTIDGVQLDLNHTIFTYTQDPLITDVQPTTSFTTFVRSYRMMFICLGGAVVERWTHDRKVAGSTPGRGTIKSTRSTQPSIPPGY